MVVPATGTRVRALSSLARFPWRNENDVFVPNRNRPHFHIHNLITCRSTSSTTHSHNVKQKGRKKNIALASHITRTLPTSLTLPITLPPYHPIKPATRTRRPHPKAQSTQPNAEACPLTYKPSSPLIVSAEMVMAMLHTNPSR